MADFRPYASLYPNEASLKNNNPAGISYFGDNSFTKSLSEQGIKWSPGTKRPSAEGAQYLSFDTVEDGMKAYDALWGTKKYQSMKVQDALNRWGTGKIGAKIDMNKTVAELTPQERSQLQVAQLSKESPGFLKEMKKAGLLKESPVQKGVFDRVMDFFIPTADAATESNYSFNMEKNQNSPAFSQGFTTPKVKEFSKEDPQSVISFIDGNGGIGSREEQVFKKLVSKGMSKQDALYQVADMKKYFMENPQKGATFFEKANRFKSLVSEGSGVKTDVYEPTAPGATEMGRFGITPQVNEDEYSQYSQYLDTIDNQTLIDQLRQGKISESQKAALKDKISQQYKDAVASGDKTRIENADFNVRKILAEISPTSVDLQKNTNEVIGDFYLPNTLRDVSVMGFKPLAGIASGLESLARGGENLGEGIAEGKGWKAIQGLVEGGGSVGTLASGPIGQAVSTALSNIDSTDTGGRILSYAMSYPQEAAAYIIDKTGVATGEDRDYAIAALRDALISGAARGTAGAVGGFKSGLSASPAATSAQKVGSAVAGSAKGAIVEGLKGSVDQFGIGYVDAIKGKLSKPSATSVPSKKIIDDAADRLQTAKKNMDSIAIVKDRFEKGDFVDAAEGMSKLKQLSGIEVKTGQDLENAVASAKESVFKEMDTAAKGKPVSFEMGQLESGINTILEQKLGRKLDDATRSTVAEAVAQIKKNLTSGGKVVANMDSVHKVASKLYDVIVGSTKDKGIMSVNAPEAYLASKEALYGQLAKIPEFSKYLDDYRNLSRMEDISNLMKAKFGSDVKNKTLTEVVPASWTGIMAGAVGAGNAGIASSALLASLMSYSRQLKKSPTNLFNDIKKISDAIDKAGEGAADALRAKLGVVKKEQLGKNAPDIGSDLLGLAGTAEFAAPSARAPQEKVSFMPAEDVMSGFEVGTPVTPKVFPAIPAGQAFGEPGFAASIGAKEAPKVPAPVAPKATVKKPAPKKESPKPAESPKKAPTAPKATKAPEKPKVAPKAKETPKKEAPVKLSAKEKASLKEIESGMKELDTKQRLKIMRGSSEDTLKKIVATFDKNSAAYRDAVAELASRK